MASSMMEKVFPVVVESVEKNLKWHWSESVKQLAENVKTMIEETDPNLYDRCRRNGPQRALSWPGRYPKERKMGEIRIGSSQKSSVFFQPQQCLHLSRCRANNLTPCIQKYSILAQKVIKQQVLADFPLRV